VSQTLNQAPSWVAIGSAALALIGAVATAIIGSFSQKRLQERSNEFQTQLQSRSAEQQSRLQKLANDLQVARSDLDARRDYEYEARKRLYLNAEPLVFQLYDAAGDAMEKVRDLAQRSREGHLGPDGYLSDNYTYYTPSTVYELLAPCALFWLLRETVTFLDLALDRGLERQYQTARLIYEVPIKHFQFAHFKPAIKYDPNRSPDDDSDIERIATTWQGLLPRELERPVMALLVTAPNGKTSLVNYARFEDALNRSNSATYRNTREFSKLLYGFSPQDKPVLWRVLIGCFFACRAFRAAQQRDAVDDVLYAPCTERESEDLQIGGTQNDRNATDAAIACALDYVE
jgi:hypothetical protein